MLKSLKRLTKHSAVYGFGHIFTRMVNFLLLPLYTNRLPADEYGVSALIFAFLAVMTPIYTYGIDAAFLRYFILSDDPVRKRRVFSTAFWAVFTAGCIFTILIYVFADFFSGLLFSHGNYHHLIRLASAILFFDVMTFLPFLYLRAEEKSILFTVFKFFNVIINVSFNIYFLVYLDKGVEGIFLANVLASGLTFLVILFILIKEVSFSFNKNDFVELCKFGLPYLPSVLSVVVLDLVDRPILERLLGLEQTGIYSAGLKLGMFMSLFVTAFRFAWHPFFLSTSKQKDAKEVFSKVLTYFTTIGMGIFLIISLYINEIVQFKFFGHTLIGSEYWQGTKVVPAILLSYVFYGIYVNFIIGVYLREKTKYLPLVTGAGVLVNIILNFALIPIIGMMGAALAKVCGYVVMSVVMFLFNQRIYAIRYEFVRLLKLALVTAGIFYFGYIFKTDWHAFMKLLFVLAFPVLLFLSGFFDKRELAKLKALVHG